MNAKSISMRETIRFLDPIFGRVPQTREATVWRVQLEVTPGQFFMSTKKYASEKSANAAAKRINKKFEARE